jgi:hypothetical protein
MPRRSDCSRNTTLERWWILLGRDLADHDQEARWRVGTKMHWFIGWFKYYSGATVPSWIFPLVWPYL